MVVETVVVGGGWWVVRQGVVGVSEIIIRPGLINVDYADVRAIMGDAGSALMGIGKGSGKNRAQEAAAAALSSPLLDFPIKQAQGVVFNVVGGSDLTLQEINSAAEVIYEAVDPNAAARPPAALAAVPLDRAPAPNLLEVLRVLPPQAPPDRSGSCTRQPRQATESRSCEPCPE